MNRTVLERQGGELLKTILLVALGFLLMSWLTGCQRTLETGGVYQGDKVLYEADKLISTSHDLMQEFINWEKNHRAVLAQYPQIRQLADKMFTEGPPAFASAVALRDLYAGDPNVENRDKLQLAIDLLRGLTREATKWMTDPRANPVP